MTTMRMSVDQERMARGEYRPGDMVNGYKLSKHGQWVRQSWLNEAGTIGALMLGVVGLVLFVGYLGMF